MGIAHGRLYLRVTQQLADHLDGHSIGGRLGPTHGHVTPRRSCLPAGRDSVLSAMRDEVNFR